MRCDLALASLVWLPAGVVVVTGQRCGRKVKRTGQPCKRWAIHGADVCPMHGANGGVKAAAARRVAAADALRRAEPFRRAGDADVDVTRILQREANSEAALVEGLRRGVEMIDPLDAIAGQQGRAVVDLYHQRQDKLVALCSDMVRLGIESRSEAMTAQYAAVVPTIFYRLISELGLSQEQRERAPAIVAAAVADVMGVVSVPALPAGIGGGRG